MTTLEAAPKSVAKPAPVAGESERMTVVALEGVAALEEHVSAWENLADAALEPNAFHEPWMLLPALQHFGVGQEVLFVLVYASASSPSPGGKSKNEHGLLCGFFPLERRRRYKGLPLKHLSLWRHLHCVLATPLIRAGHGPQTLKALFDWLREDPRGTGLLELDFITADGPLHHLLIDDANAHGRLSYVDEVSTRALLRTGDDGEAYLQNAISGGVRKELRRQRRRLGDLGRLETRVLQTETELPAWIDDFLKLEASGWKGKEGTALGVHANECSFFRDVAQAAYDRQRLMMLGLFLDEKPIALKCNFLMGNGAIAFKIAFDETFARFSPGVQLELDNILQLHALPGPRWMDSCAVSKHSMINRLWSDRRVMRTVLVSTGRRGGDLSVSVLPLLRWLQRLVKRKPKTEDHP